MDIGELRKKAKDGRVEAQKELAHAYLEGNGVPKNRAHYLTWLTKAAERGDVDSQKELAKFYNDKRSNYSNPKEALFWMRKAQEQGAEFSDEERAEIEAGNSSACCEKNTCSRTVLSRVFRILGTLIDAIGVRALLLSTVLLLCIIFIDWSWIERLRYGLNELLPGLAILTYLGLFALLTTVFSVIFKYLDKKKDEEYRNYFQQFDWYFPEFTVENREVTSGENGGFFGRTTRYTEYILRFKDEKYQESWPKSGFWENPDYPMEHESASLERIDDYRVKITICYEYIP